MKATHTNNAKMTEKTFILHPYDLNDLKQPQN